MTIYRETLTVNTQDRGTTHITQQVCAVVKRSGIADGLCNVFLHHTSASLILCENADPTVQADLERFFARLVPDGDRIFRHNAEGPDDMPAHVRSVLTTNSLNLPVAQGRCALGTWQGVYVWEHRKTPHDRRLTLTVLG